MARLFDSRDSDSASNAPKAIHTNLLNNPEGNVIDISHLDHKEYRFLDCHALLEDDQFRLVSFGTLSTLRYAAVSYLWRGTPSSVRNDSPCFTVAGAESLPPVNIHVLRLACKLANRLGADYLWLDLQSRTCFHLSVGLLLQSIDPQPQLITNTDIARISVATESRHLHVVGMYAPVWIRAEYCRMLRYDLDRLHQSRYSKGQPPIPLPTSPTPTTASSS